MEKAKDQKSFAEAAGLAPSTVHQYLTEKQGRASAPKISSLIRIAQAGGVSLDWLATGKGPGPGNWISVEFLERLLIEAEEKMQFAGMEPGEMTPRGRVEFILSTCREALAESWYPDLLRTAGPAPAPEQIRKKIIELARRALRTA